MLIFFVVSWILIRKSMNNTSMKKLFFIRNLQMKFDKNRASSLSSTGKIFLLRSFFLGSDFKHYFHIFILFLLHTNTTNYIHFYISFSFVAYFWMHHSKFILTSSWRLDHLLHPPGSLLSFTFKKSSNFFMR